MAKKGEKIIFETVKMALNEKYYINVKGVKESLDYLNIKDKDQGQRNDLYASEERFAKEITKGDKKIQKLSTFNALPSSSRIIVLPSKKEVPSTSTSKSGRRYYNYTLVFPRGINLILVASALHNAVDFAKLRPIKNRYAFKPKGGYWHPIGEVAGAMLDKIIKEYNEAVEATVSARSEDIKATAVKEVLNNAT